ncbi:MAG: hypothetical protein KC613_12910 [Myxococcales bacterium]|nr:hypothetical protein [Myxococcales bacterium]MCB9524929.1 hypothetical protein [Myxococcales bacterium]
MSLSERIEKLVKAPLDELKQHERVKAGLEALDGFVGRLPSSVSAPLRAEGPLTLDRLRTAALAARDEAEQWWSDRRKVHQADEAAEAAVVEDAELEVAEVDVASEAPAAPKAEPKARSKRAARPKPKADDAAE